MFHEGQKVVCVDERPCACCDIPTPCAVRKGIIYTVASCLPSLGLLSDWAVTVVEVPTSAHRGHAGFRAERFRPIEEKKTDISVFTEMLKSEKQDA